MPSNDGDPIEGLRLQVRQNPKEARRQVQAILSGDPLRRAAFLAGLGGVGDGRLRQCVANAVVAEPSLLPLAAECLQAWLTTETDEFARRSITAALQQTGGARKTAQKAGMIDTAVVGAYRYVSDRLAHELRNALLVPQARMRELQELIGGLADDQTRAEILACVGRLGDDFQEVGRLAVSNPDDEYFRFRPIAVLEWIERMKSSYAKRYCALGFEAMGPPAAQAARVVANDYYLRLIFWNLWLNSHQAVGNTCKISIEFGIDGERLRLVVLDSGTGFRPDAVGIAFQDRFSKHGEHRGRGLLEVQDAIERLHGSAELVKHASGTHRVALELPVTRT